MEIPIDTPLGFIGLLMLVAGLFLLLTGFSIVKVQKVTVRPGRGTWGTGLALTLIGLALVVVGDPSPKAETPTPTAQPSTPLPSPFIEITEPPVVVTTTKNPQDDPYALLAKASAWPVTVSETFDDPGPKWNGFGTQKDEWTRHNMRFENGRLVWGLEVFQPGGVWYFQTTPYFSYADFYLSFKFKRDPEPVNSANYGLVFRKQGNRDYMFRINDNQRFSVFLYDLDNWIELIGWTRDEVIQPGRFNELTVIAIGDTMHFYINQRFVGTPIDSTLDKGEIAFMVGLSDAGSEVTFEFDDFVLREKP